MTMIWNIMAQKLILQVWFPKFSFWFCFASLGSSSPEISLLRSLYLVQVIGLKFLNNFFYWRSWTKYFLPILVYKKWIFLELETEAEIYEKLGYYLWSPGGNGQNARYQASFDFGTNLTCDTKINDIKVLLLIYKHSLYEALL